MKRIIRDILLFVSLSILLAPITAHAKAPIEKLVASSIAYSLQEGVQEYYSYGYFTTEPSGESWYDVYTNNGQGWKFMEKECNEMGVYLDENGMIIEDPAKR